MPSQNELAALRVRLRRVQSGDPLVITTSGSTESPKRVALTWDALAAAAQASAARIGSGNWLLALPTEYVAGAMVDVRAQLAGGKTRAWGAESFAAAASALPAPRYVSLVPAQLLELLDEPASVRALASFAAVLVGGQRMRAELREQADSAGVRVVATYGSTETAGGCVYDGRPLSGVQVRIDENERLWIAGPMLAAGYLTEDGSFDRARTEAAFAQFDGVRWLRTDDRARLSHDEHGARLEILGRIDDVMISGGLKLDLAEVQRLLDARLGAGQAVAVPLAHERWGQQLGVWRFDQPLGAEPSIGEAELAELLLTQFGVHARARIGSGPRLHTATGKPDRQAIIARLSAE